MIRTVLGDIPQISGAILTHEHIQCTAPEFRFAFQNWPDYDTLETRAVEVLTQVRRDTGLALFVDGPPADLGRDAALLRRVAEKSEVNIVASTGFYYFPSCISAQRSAGDLAALILRECREGLDGTDVLPGILKCAVETAMTPDCAKRMAALGIVQRETGLPLYAHCRHTDSTGHETLDILKAQGAELSKVTLGHATSRLDPDYLEGLLLRGCYVNLDQCSSGIVEQTAEVVAELCRRGWAEKLMFSLDRPIYNEFAAPADTGLDFPPSAHIRRYEFLFDTMIPAFRRAGCTEEQCLAFLHQNPSSFLNI